MKRILLAMALAALWVMAAPGNRFSTLSAGENLRVGYGIGGASSVIPMLAVEEKLGDLVDSHPEYTSFLSSADGLNALNVNKIDVGVSFGTCAPLTFITQGAKFVIIAGNISGGHPVISRPEAAEQFKTIDGFRGKTVGSPRLYTSDVVWRGAAHKAGLDLEKDLTLIEFRRPLDVFEAVKSGKVDVGIGASNLTANARKSGLAIPMFSNDLFPHHPCCRVVATRAAVESRRPELVRYLKSLLLAEKKYNDDPEAAVRSNMRQQNLDEDIARELALEPHQEYAIDPNTQGIIKMWDYMKACKYIESDQDPREFIDTSLYLQALAEVKVERPSPFWEKLELRFREWND
ncbi:MAG: ABC transporter substrate-binding protein [Planctomycetota bacterium]|nr:ABC transporter substrate-binding protein [Planctomycetota bacterium]